MKIKFLLLLCIFSFATSYGQNKKKTSKNETKKGELKVEKKRIGNHGKIISHCMGITESYGDGFVVAYNSLNARSIVATGGRIFPHIMHYENFSSLFITRVNSDLSIDSKVKIRNTLLGKKVNYHQLLKVENTFFVTFTYTNMSALKTYFFAQKYDAENETFEGNPFKIAELPYEKKRRRDFVGVTSIYSQNKKCVAICLKKDANDDYSNPLICVLDKNLQILNYLKPTDQILNGNKGYFKDILVSDYGDIVVHQNENYTTKEVKKGRKTKKNGEISKDLKAAKVFMVSKEGKFYLYKPETEGNNVAGSLIIKLNEDNTKVLIAGIYSENSNAQGEFSAVLDMEDFEEIKYVQYPFYEEMINSYLTGKEDKEESKKTTTKKSKYLSDSESPSKKGKSITKSLFINDAIFEKDSFMYGMYEDIYSVIYTSSNSKGQTSSYTVYVYGDMLITRPAEEERKYTVVRKNQQSRFVNTPHTTSFISKDNSLVVFLAYTTIGLSSIRPAILTVDKNDINGVKSFKLLNKEQPVILTNKFMIKDTEFFTIKTGYSLEIKKIIIKI